MSRQLAGGEALERRKRAVDTSPVVAAELAVWAVLRIVRHVPRIHVYKEANEGSPRVRACGRPRVEDVDVYGSAVTPVKAV